MMKKALRRIRQLIPEDPHLWFAFVAAGLYLLGDILRWDWLPASTPTYVVMICILMIVTDRLKVGDEVRNNTKKLNRIAVGVFRKNVELRRRPTTPPEYDYLWGGFTGEYHAYNPAYRLDENMGIGDVAKILTHRFRHPAFKKAKYLFFRQGTAGHDEWNTFRRIMSFVERDFPDVVKMIEVRLIAKDPSCDAEIYIGTRNDKPTAILELKDAALGASHGKPHYYLMIHDKEIIENYLKSHFYDDWERAQPQNIFEDLPAVVGTGGPT